MKTGTGMWIATTVQRGPLNRAKRIRKDRARASYRHKMGEVKGEGEGFKPGSGIEAKRVVYRSIHRWDAFCGEEPFVLLGSAFGIFY
jgi:hypothetical protein